MDDRELLIVIRTMTEKIGMLEWDNEQLRKRLKESQARVESMQDTIFCMSGGTKAVDEK